MGLEKSSSEVMKINLPTDNFISFKGEVSGTANKSPSTRDYVFDGTFQTVKTSAAFQQLPM